MSEKTNNSGSLLSYGKGRSLVLDIAKAIAIFAVILYHAGVFSYGYLGVDVFFVINGYLVMSGIIRRVGRGERFSYFNFIYSKILSFWPLVLICAAVSLAIGFFTMLPDDLENLSQSVVASNFFANNLLSAITTKNYWDVVNEFKPLMHTWYISLLMQTYVVLPLIVKLCTKTKSFLRSCGYSLAAFTAVSFALYLLPVFSDSDKFYFPFFRFFEVTLGAIIAVYSDKLTKAVKKLGASKFAILTTISAIGVASLFVVPDGFKDEILLIGVCIISAMVIIIDLPSEKSGKYPFVLRFIGMFGKITFGVYLWHQIILAFVRYTITTEFSPVHILLYFLFTLFIGFISYYLIEKPISLLCAKGKHGKATVFVCCILLCLLTSVCSLLLYKNAGVVRDIPELDIVKADAHRNMHAEYCDRGYLYDKDFEKPEKINVLVIGVSFARDYINILLESDFSDKLELSYIHTVSPEQVMSHKSRFEQADFILYSISNVKAAGIPSYLDDYYEKGNVYLIGNKSFGNCNGIIYNKRNDEDYLNSSVKIDEAYIKQNKLFSEKYNDHFIDMLTPVMLDDQTVRVFTDDGKFISQDTRHLTRSGAIYYSKLLDFSWLVG